MLAAVDFNDELRFGTEEVDDVSADRLLAKAEAVELLAPQARPQSDFGIRRCGAQSASVGRRHAAMLALCELRRHPPP
jgi:hypothetical protein